ncbi:MAG: heavy metal translocating P-type ATPase [Aestuariibacter sp.]
MLSPQPGHCFHCHLPVPDGISLHSDLFEQRLAFCCPGCQAVCETIVDNGLGDYYKYRTEAAEQASDLPDDLFEQHRIFDEPAVQDDFVAHHPNHVDDIELTIEGLNCPACAWLIERQLAKTNGILQIGVDASARRATVKWHNQELKLSQILDQLAKLGYRAHPFSPDHYEAIYQKENKRFLKKLGLAGLMTMQVMMIAFALYFGVFGDLDPEIKHFFHWVSAILTTPVVLYSASGFFVSALNGLSVRTLNMDLPISIAIILTYISSCYATFTNSGRVFFESICMFIFLLLIGRYLELKGREKAVRIANNINKQIPTMAQVQQEDGHYQPLPAKLVKPGQIIKIRPGDTIPVDALITDGQSQVDESLLTGEATPISKSAGQTVYGGTTNQDGVLFASVSEKLSNSAIFQIMKLQRLAATQKPAFALLVDQFASYFVAAVLLISVATFGYWYVTEPQQAVWITVTVLVATCPCALGLATPTAFSAALAKLNQSGFLLKRADVLETLNNIDTIAFDKTGTLTQGNFELSRVHNVSDASDEEILNIAANLEQVSEHPIATAFKVSQPLSMTEVTNHPGAGVAAKLNDNSYRIGSYAFAVAENAPPDNQKGYRVFLSSVQDEQYQLLAAFDVVDQARDGAKTLRAALQHQQLMLLSGDRNENVQRLASELSFQQYYGQCLPEDKLKIVDDLQQQHHKVMMIGDGMNDSPVLAKADVSLAVSGATDFARQSADVVMLNEQIEQIPMLFLTAAKTFRIIKQNMLWAVGYNLVVLPMAVSGMLSPWMAVLGMSLSSLIVTYNSTRIIT